MNNKIAFILAPLFASLVSYSSIAQTSSYEQDSILIREIYDEVLANGEIYSNLRSLTKDIGHRLSGSPQADQAMVWGANLFRQYGADSVFIMPVEVPSWTRNDIAEARVHMSDGRLIPLHITALGGSVSTPENSPIRSKIVIVKHIDELAELDDVEGKIALFNRPMDPVLINTGAAYGGANDQRSYGAIKASEAGAIGALVRSLTHSLDTVPHTGAMRYSDEVEKIPAAAISTVDARLLAQLLEEDSELEVEFVMNCKALPNVIQGNVVGEWTGSTYPNEVITLGGHLDSWDIGEGAHDDGAGVVHTIETLRLLKAVGYTPKRTIRFVLFINEENGNRGGIEYARIANEESLSGDKIYVAAMESDAGGFSPRGFSLDAPFEQFELFKNWQSLFEPYGLYHFKRGWAGVDIGPLKKLDHRPFMVGLKPDGQRYFDFHHTANDTFENVHKRELELGAAAMASIIMLIDKHLPSPNHD